MQSRLIILFILAALSLLPLRNILANSESEASFTYQIARATSEIKVDGVLDEQAWSDCNVLTDFTLNYPVDDTLASTRTEVRLTYNDRFLYVSALCFDKSDQEFVVQSLKRDFSYPRTDAFAVFLNPMNDRQNGFSFAANPYGVQREGILTNGGSFGVTTIWDNKWFVEVERESDRWVVEMAIPFKTLRFSSEIESWRVNFGRQDLKRNESSTWVPVPKVHNVASMAFTGHLVWDQPPKKTGANVALIPYAIGGMQIDYDEESAEKMVEGDYNVGLDAKIAITPSLNLDVTINPDFSQVEVDDQLVNLDRFSLFLPEKRTFFIENSDLFGFFGFSRIRPFFSRRIGLQNGAKVPILGGFRLSGNVNSDWRIGLMSIQTEGGTETGQLGQNYSVGAFQRRLFARSNIGAILVNRQAFNDYEWVKGNNNTLLGLDFNFADKKDKLRGKIFYHETFTNGHSKDAGANASWLSYESTKLDFHWNHEYVGKNYNAEVGYLQRRDFFRLEPSIGYSFYPEGGKINKHRISLYNSTYWNSDWKTTDRLVMASYSMNFLNYSSFKAYYREAQRRVAFQFSPYKPGAIPLEAGNYVYRDAGVSYNSDFRKRFSYYGEVIYGGFFSGTKLTMLASANYRLQPWGNISINYQRNQIRFPGEAGDGNLDLVGGKVELSFTKDLFFTTFVQYNTQADNFNINSRFQWRFKPLSDLFIVYTDNYDTDFFKKNRALVVKLNYWFSI